MSKITADLKSIASKDVTVDDLAAQIGTLKNDLATLTQKLSEFGVSKAESASHAAQAKASELKSAGQEKALEAQLHAEDFVRNQPAASLGIAAGLGFLIGMITARR
ncbi:DUF883 family protein [Sulfitobacter guttiformis]|uniref:ElaB/YqjD/DUF883 family membrane-anchored ribosome-binding protein n=1 Tax=Sulfitobacter guttiformis TaxID=74349 RepID=A0A420DR72_9RHOB|nr:DUF883 family protein [Sulfitobacter guttiformis]KIN74162.1 hypothetical protein Z949_3358 [Sulfitobacter guttiformis KCTC 32187]RKE96776.1 ElaB/YqjD/DUF883 family membrane-anchored ribosome-binding protein [Sulfitobacter guttiformis]